MPQCPTVISSIECECTCIAAYRIVILSNMSVFPGAFPRWHWVRGGAQPAQISSLSKGPVCIYEMLALASCVMLMFQALDEQLDPDNNESTTEI